MLVGAMTLCTHPVCGLVLYVSYSVYWHFGIYSYFLLLKQQSYRASQSSGYIREWENRHCCGQVTIEWRAGSFASLDGVIIQWASLRISVVEGVMGSHTIGSLVVEGHTVHRVICHIDFRLYGNESIIMICCVICLLKADWLRTYVCNCIMFWRGYMCVHVWCMCVHVGTCVMHVYMCMHVCTCQHTDSPQNVPLAYVRTYVCMLHSSVTGILGVAMTHYLYRLWSLPYLHYSLSGSWLPWLFVSV